jgi:hypothetical protein
VLRKLERGLTETLPNIEKLGRNKLAKERISGIEDFTSS